MKKIPVKNYIILGLVIIIMFVLILYIRGWYITYRNYYNDNSVIKEVTHEINIDEISSYTIESQKFILYTSSGQNGSIRDFESNLKKIIQKLDISDDVLYLNLDSVDAYNFSLNLKKKYSGSKDINSKITGKSVATFYVFIDGKIVSVLNNSNNYTMKYIESYFKKWGFNND